MKSKGFIVFALGVVCLFIGSGAFAQMEQEKQQPSQAEIDQFMGQTLKTQKGEELGTINEAVVGQDGTIKYLVLSRETGWGLTEDNKITIPWDSVQIQRQQEGEVELTADIDLAQLELQPLGLQQQQEGAKKLEQVLGKTVQGRQGEELGTIGNLVLSPQGQASYVILSGEEAKQYPVPINALQPGQEEDTFQLDIAKQQLQEAPSFSETMPDLSSQEWQQEVQGYYGQQQQLEREKSQQMMEEEPQVEMFQEEQEDGEIQEYFENGQQKNQQTQQEGQTWQRQPETFPQQEETPQEY